MATLPTMTINMAKTRPIPTYYSIVNDSLNKSRSAANWKIV